MKAVAHKAKEASKVLMALDHKTRKIILETIANEINQKKDKIIIENKKDLENANKNKLNPALIDRLLLDEKRIISMINGVREIAVQPDVVHEYFDEHINSAGLKIKKQRVPIGVLLMIFESRPNVVIDSAALAIKSSNAIILKGGKEAKYSNEILGEIVQCAISKYIPKESVQILASDKRQLVDELLSLNEHIDLVIPRGGEKLIRHVYDNSKIPVIAHFLGLCHIYIDKDADDEKALNIVLNAKTQRPGVCNAVETLIIHKDKLPLLPRLIEQLQEKGTELRIDSLILSKINFENVKQATNADWSTEYLDNILSIKLALNIDQAIEHIQKYGSHHSEAIITENKDSSDYFFKLIDASCVLWNASTRFNDGGQLGLGAELGISTTKIHAYGPMGAKEMTTSRFVVIGNGHIRS